MNDTANNPDTPLNFGILPEELRRALNRFPDLSGIVGESQPLDAAAEGLPHLRLESAGVSDLLGLPEYPSVLLWNWEGLVMARYLLDNASRVRICDSRAEYLEVARLLCGDDSIHSPGDPLTGSGVPDVVFVGSKTKDSQDLFAGLGQILIKTLDQGGVIMAAEPQSSPHPITSILRANSPEGDSLGEESILALPDLDNPELLIRQTFLYETPGAWRHLAGYVDEFGGARFPGSVPIRDVWSLFEESQRFPLQDVSKYQVFWRRDKAERDPIELDFIHQSIGQRVRQYWTKTIKPRGETIVERAPIFEIENLSEGGREEQKDIEHVLNREGYQTGPTLDELWLDALRRNDVERFKDLAQRFFEFLKTISKGQTTVWVDLLPDNVLVDDDNFIPIDQEWRCPVERLSLDAMYCRALVYFLSRSALALDSLPAARRWGATHYEFLVGACGEVGVAPDPALTAVEEFERMFRRETLLSFGVIEITSMLARRFGDQDVVELVGSLGQKEESERSHAVIPFPSNSSRSGCRFVFRFSSYPGIPEVLDLMFPSWLGLPRIKAGTVTSAGNACALGVTDTEEIDVGAVADIFRGRFSDRARGVRVAINSGLLLPSPDFSYDFDLEMVWPEMVFGPDAEERLVRRLWGKEGMLNEARDRVLELESELAQSEKKHSLKHAELELLKSSKAWRVAEVLRKIFFGWRKPQDVVRNLSAIEQLSQKPAPPTERFSHVTQVGQNNVDSDITATSAGPLISVVIPVYNTPKAWLADAVNSVRGQTYPHWHLILVNDGSTNVGTREFLDNLDDPRVTKIQLTRSAGISVATQMAVDGAHGEFVALMDHDDMLAPSALQKVAEKITDHNADVVYTDETTFSDRTEQKHDGYFGLPHLKPDYSPDLLLCHNYITHLLVIRKGLINQVGGFRPEFDGAQDFDLLLRVTEQTDRVIHISEPLYHWRQSVQSTSLDTGAKPLAHMRGCQAVTEALDRRGIQGEVLTANGPHFFRVRRKIIDQPLVEIVIPFRDQPLMLRKCIEALLANTRYPQYRILGVDNGSTETLTHELMSQYESETDHVRFARLDVPFNFSQIVNFGVQNAQGSHVVLMNNDIEVINSDWLEAMLEHSQRPEVGAVGAKLYYPDDTIQHAGIAIGIGSYAGHPHKHVEGGYSGYLNRLHNIQNVSAVTGAMLMVKRELYNALGGFDEHLFKVACNDVDFCLRLRSQGLLNIFTPYARAYHHESVSRGYEDTPERKARFEKEVNAFRKRHGEVLSQGDPYYNRHLRLDTEAVLARPWSEV